MAKLKGEAYTGVVTIFSIVLLVEYTQGTYDLWDILIALITIRIGFKLVINARENLDQLYTCITAGIISLGFISFLFSLKEFLQISWLKSNNELYEIVKFLLFLLITMLTKFLIQKHIKKSSQRRHSDLKNNKIQSS